MIIAAATLAGCRKERSMKDGEFDAFVQECRADLRELIDQSVDRWHLDRAEAFDFD